MAVNGRDRSGKVGLFVFFVTNTYLKPRRIRTLFWKRCCVEWWK